MFIVDTSGSIVDRYTGDDSITYLDKVLNTVNGIIYNLAQGDRDINFGMVSFANVPRIGFYLNTYTDINDIMRAVNNTPVGGYSTNVADAFEIARARVFGQDGDRPDAPNIIIFISDGDVNLRYISLEIEVLNYRKPQFTQQT